MDILLPTNLYFSSPREDYFLYDSLISQINGTLPLKNLLEEDWTVSPEPQGAQEKKKIFEILMEVDEERKVLIIIYKFYFIFSYILCVILTF
jgi:hypothetical protein